MDRPDFSDETVKAALRQLDSQRDLLLSQARSRLRIIQLKKERHERETAMFAQERKARKSYEERERRKKMANINQDHLTPDKN